MLVELIVLCFVGVLLIVLGLLIWKRQMIGLIHEYHHRNVRPENVAAYTKRVGIAQILFGGCTVGAGVVDFVSGTLWGWALFVAGLVVFFIIMHFAQMKYNGSWFS